MAFEKPHSCWREWSREHSPNGMMLLRTQLHGFWAALLLVARSSYAPRRALPGNPETTHPDKFN